jgi:hypothetical protein
MSSCIKEESTLSELIYINNTKNTISFKVFQNSYISDSFKILPNSEFNKESFSERGLSKEPIIFFDFLRESDSIIVTFNDSFSLTHLNDSVTYGKKRISYFSSRSLYGANYINIKVDEKKNYIHYKKTFTFTEQDYLDAKQ